jgi:hypothetical protein
MIPASWLRDTLGVRRAAFAETFNAVEVMAMRPEDRNARQVQQAFADGATLDELDMQTVTLGAAKLQVTPMAWQTRAGGSHAL